eukprot:150668-Rhodomonas_salina.1
MHVTAVTVTGKKRALTESNRAVTCGHVRSRYQAECEAPACSEDEARAADCHYLAYCDKSRYKSTAKRAQKAAVKRTQKATAKRKTKMPGVCCSTWLLGVPAIPRVARGSPVMTYANNAMLLPAGVRCARVRRVLSGPAATSQRKLAQCMCQNIWTKASPDTSLRAVYATQSPEA